LSSRQQAPFSAFQGIFWREYARLKWHFAAFIPSAPLSKAFFPGRGLQIE
jgi:hypothetical protein